MRAIYLYNLRTYGNGKGGLEDWNEEADWRVEGQQRTKSLELFAPAEAPA